ncbi:MAG: hypothetical protein KC503_32710 [Myxococcales bacterium]|nr:hypothetical protein [Myxococcales bacterium]
MRYTVAASVRRRARWGWFAVALLVLLPVFAIGSCTVADLKIRLGDFVATHRWWAVSHFTCLVARTCFLVLGVAALCWMFANALRGAFRLPPRTSRQRAFRIGQIVLGVVVGLVICAWSIDEKGVRHMTWSPLGALLLGLLWALPLYYRVPGLFAGIVSALRERARVGGALVSLEQLPPSGRVRTAGVIVGAADIDAKGGDVVYERDLSSGRELARSLLLQDGSARVWVDAPPGALLVEADAETEPPNPEPHDTNFVELARLRVGDRVQVIGEVSGSGERGYRDALPRIGAHRGQLYLLAEPSRLRSRLLLAALVESMAALAMLIAPLSFIAWWWQAGGHAYLDPLAPLY